MKKLIVAVAAAAGLFAVVNRKKKTDKADQKLWSDATDRV